MSNTSVKQRRSLKGALKTILLKCRRQTPDDTLSPVGSGILRRDPSIPALTNESTTAFLLGLESAPNDDENDRSDIPDRFDISSLATSAAMSSTQSLMPKISLSQFEYNPTIQETRYLQRGYCSSTSSSLGDGVSCQASLRTLRSFRSTSTLRIQSSTQSLRSDSATSSQMSFRDAADQNFESIPPPSTMFQCPSPPRSNHNLSPQRSMLRKRASFGTPSNPSPLRQSVRPTFEADPVQEECPVPYDYGRRFGRPLSAIEEVASYLEDPLTPRQSPIPSFRGSQRMSTPRQSPALSSPQTLRTPTPRQSPVPSLRETQCSSKPQFLEPNAGMKPSVKSDATHPLLSVKHFSSFCAIDSISVGGPVMATSKELKYIFEIGESYCLNTQGCEGVSMDVITGSDAVGNSITHLVLFSPLIIPHSGRSRFMLASLIDVTDFLHDAASLPELEMVSEESAESDPPTPTCNNQPFPKTPKYQLSAESLLSGCFMDDPHTPVQRYDEDIWINLATEERKQYSQQSRISSGSRTPISATSTLNSVNDVLDDFMCQLQELHADFFLLAKSPLDDNYYEICNVSPKVYQDRDYVNGHLSKTSALDMANLSSRLAGDDPFDMEVKWGTRGTPRRLYCTPLFARSAITWVCFLVDPGLPILW